MHRPLSKTAYREWLARTMEAINGQATPIRPLKEKDFSMVNFDALWRQRHSPEEAAHIAKLVALYSTSV